MLEWRQIGQLHPTIERLEILVSRLGLEPRALALKGRLAR